MNKYLDFRNYILGSYFVPFFSSHSIYVIIRGHTTLATYKVDAVGAQARLIGLFFLSLALLNMYFILFAIPRSINEEKVKVVLNLFFSSPFFVVWNALILIRIFHTYMEYSRYIYLGLLFICFLLQLSLNKKIVQIYLK